MRYLSWAFGLVAGACWTATSLGFGGDEHTRISAVAAAALPAAGRDLFKAELPAYARIYCNFPDQNWPCMGQWGGGTGDPQQPRMADARRAWDISYYCDWDPVARKGKPFVHRPPESFEAAAHFYRKTTESLKEGRIEDAARFLGVLSHYVQDSAAFGHIQPVHRSFHVRDLNLIRLEAYEPRLISTSADAAAEAAANRVMDLVKYSERRIEPLLAVAQLPLEELKSQCARELMPPQAVGVIQKLLKERRSDWDDIARDCAVEAARACADILHTAATLAGPRLPVPATGAIKGNMIFNPSFELDDGTGHPEGWYVEWCDLKDRAARAQWYLAKTHWENHVRSGQRSAHLRWCPPAGVEWRPTWRHAVRVEPGETYFARAQVDVRGQGAASIGLAFFDQSYNVIATPTLCDIKSGSGWQKAQVSAQAPAEARWLKVILRCDRDDAAAWFDDVELMRR